MTVPTSTGTLVLSAASDLKVVGDAEDVPGGVA
jgi:hypothetical protein